MAEAFRILVVDDEAGIRDLLQLELEAEGYTVVLAPNGRDALEIIRQQRFDLVVSDIMMPQLDGMELLDALKTAVPDTRLIFMTGYGTVETAVKAMKKGADDFLIKPFSLEEMLALARKSKDKILQSRVEKSQTDKLVELGKLTASLIHDLRNPLSGIGLLMQTLLEDSELTPELREDLTSVLQQSKDCGDMINTVLQYSRKGLGTTRAVPLKALLEQLLKLMRLELKDTGIEVKVKEIAGPCVVLGNPVQLQQIFMNLISNARQAMAHQPNKSLTIRIEKMESKIGVSVIDTGCGIAADQIEKIFDPFFTTKPEGEGTGLGLYICRDLISQHQGQIKVHSEVGHGTTFSVELPAAIDSSLQAA